MPQPQHSPIIVEHRVRHETIPRPAAPVRKTILEINLEKQIQTKRERLAEALEAIRRQRADIKMHGGEQFETLWAMHGEMIFDTEIAIAEKEVRECLGNVEAELFRNDADFPRTQDPRFPNYSQMLINLEQYECRLIDLIKRLQ